MTRLELADKILARYEDDNEYHFHQVDREWIIEAMVEFEETFNTEECTFYPTMNTSSATICGVCGKEKFEHNL